MSWKFYDSNGRLLVQQTAGSNQLSDLSDVSAAAQTANFVLAAGDGSTGGDYRGRALVAADIPNLATSKITSGQLILEQGGTEADLSATGPGVLQQRTAGAVFTSLKYNFSATAAPAVTDDDGDGYDEGSWWFDLTNDKAYVCLDASTGAAVWTELGSGGSGAPTDAKYIVQEANGSLSAEQSLGALTTGILLNTVTGSVGVLSTAVGADLPSHNHAASQITSGQLILEQGGTEADLSATGPGVLQQRTAGAAFTNLKYNFSATAAPAVTDDDGDGYDEGSWWFDLTNDKAYVCLDASTGAAVWTELGSGGGDAGDITYTPAVATDWDGDADPGDVDNALDQLAERVDDLEAGGATTDADAIHDNVSGEIAAITEKTTTVAADLVVIEDSAASNAKKRVTLGNLIGGLTTAILALLPVNIALIEDQKTQNTGGGTFTSGADRVRDLNTEVYDAGGIVSIASNQVTIAATSKPGIYVFLWLTPAYKTNGHQSMLYSVTGTATLKRGSTEFAYDAGDATTNKSFGFYIASLTSDVVYEIRHRATTTAATLGFGAAANLGAEVYTQLLIIRFGWGY